LCELKLVHALRHFIKHLLCIREKTKLAHPLSHLPKKKNIGEGWWAALFIGMISRTGTYLKPVQKGGH
jgi:hypothetical protein